HSVFSVERSRSRLQLHSFPTRRSSDLVTVRENTERPVTVSSGTNTIAGTRTERIRNAIKAQTKSGLSARAPEKWDGRAGTRIVRSEEHTSELQSPYDLVCRLLLEKKKT